MTRMQPGWAPRRARPTSERIEGQGIKRRTLDRDRIMVVITYASKKSFVRLSKDPQEAERWTAEGNAIKGATARWFWVDTVNGEPFVPPQEENTNE